MTATNAASNDDRFQGLGARLAVALLTGLALLQATFFVIRGGPVSADLFAVAIAGASLLARWRLRSRQLWCVVGLSLLAVLVGVNLSVDIVRHDPPFVFRLLEVGLVYAYTALALAGITGLIFRGVFTRAALVLCSIAAMLTVGEAIFERRTDVLTKPGGVRWEGGIVADSILGERYAPNSILKTYYPDNPRGYFDRSDPWRSRWRLETHGGSEARLQFETDRQQTMRVLPGKATGTAWHIQLNEAGIPFRVGRKYVLRFRARAKAPRSMVVSTTQGHSPWDNLGHYHEVPIDTTWQSYSEVLSPIKTDDNGRVGFNLGASEAAVELAEIALLRLPDNEPVEPSVPTDFSVTYKMNGMGCRGRDYPIPRDSATWRILTLGDSYALGVGVHEPDVFSAQLERLLNSSTDPHRARPAYEVINCGVSGYSTREERLFYEQVGVRYSPDVVLLTAVLNDDISWREEVANRYVVMADKYQQFFLTWGMLQEVRANIRRPRHDFSRVRDEVRRLAALCEQHRTRLAIVILQSDDIPLWRDLTQAVDEGVRDTGVPVLKMGPLLASQFGKLAVHPKYDAHPNEAAHRRTAEALRDFLRQHRLDGSDTSRVGRF